MKLKKRLVALLAVCALVCAAPAGISQELSEPDVPAISVEEPVEEVEFALEAGQDEAATIPDIQEDEAAPLDLGEAISKQADALEPKHSYWTIATNTKLEMRTIDTLHLSVSSVDEVLSWTSGSKKIVPSIDFNGSEAIVKPVAAGKVTLKASVMTGGKKKSFSVTVTVTDPYIPTGIRFGESMPASVPVGTSLNVAEHVGLIPAYARGDVTIKVSGAAKLAKDGVTLTATKAGKATITVTSKQNRKAKATYKLDVLANKIANLYAKPTQADVSAVNGGWTLRPYAVELLSKGGLECQFYLVNGTGQKAARIQNMNLTLYQNGSQIAQHDFSSLKVSVAKNKAALIKVEFPAGSYAEGFFLPDGGLTFDVDMTSDFWLVTDRGSYKFIPTIFPTYDSFDDIVDHAYANIISGLQKEAEPGEEFHWHYANLTGHAYHDLLVVYTPADSVDDRIVRVYCFENWGAKLVFDYYEYGIDRVRWYEATGTVCLFIAGHGSETHEYYRCDGDEFTYAAGAFYDDDMGTTAYFDDSWNEISKASYDALVKSLTAGETQEFLLNPESAVDPDKTVMTAAEVVAFLEKDMKANGKSYGANLCLKYISDVYGKMGFKTPYNLGSAIKYWNALKAEGKTHEDPLLAVPIGADVFFNAGSDFGVDGHVGIYVGDGYIIHNRTLAPTDFGVVKQRISGNDFYTRNYLGWAWHGGVTVAQ